MGIISASEKDKVLSWVAESNGQKVDIDVRKHPDNEAIKHLVNLGVLVINHSLGYGDNSRVSLTSKGAELYAKGGAKGGAKGERKREIIEIIWKGLDVFIP